MDKIEKKLRKRGMQKLDKFAHNPYHVDKPSFFSKIPLWGKIAIPASLVTAVTVVAFFGIINGVGSSVFANRAPASNNKGAASTSAINKAGSESQADVTSINPGESGTPAYNRYSSLAYNGAEYALMPAGGDDKSGLGGEHSQSITLGNLLYETTNPKNNEVISVYAITGYIPDAFVAAKFSTDPSTYVCYNPECSFATTGNLLTDIPFATDFFATGHIDECEINPRRTTVYSPYGSQVLNINSILFDELDTTIPNIASTFTEENSQKYIQMNFMSLTFNYMCCTVRVYNSGHLAVVMERAFATHFINVYEIGVERYNSLLEYTHTLQMLR